MKISVVIVGVFLNCVLFAQETNRLIPRKVSAFSVNFLKSKIYTAWYGSSTSPEIGVQNEKMELGFNLPRDYTDRIDAFFEQGGDKFEKINPFNRHDIDITCDFFRDGKQVKTVDAFYFEQYHGERRVNKWMKDTTSFRFRARFLPEDEGNYQVTVTITSKWLKTATFSLGFSVLAGTGRGMLEKTSDGKHFRFSHTKKSFMPVGQVIPWAELHDGKSDQPSRPREFEILTESLKDMHAARGNFTRFVAAPWFLEMESEALGNYQPKLGQACFFDALDEICDRDSIYYIFCLRLHTPLETHPNDEMGWERNCYNDLDKTPPSIAHEPKIGISDISEYFSNETAKDHNKNYFRYMVSRWGYSTALAGWQIVSEIDNTINYRDVKIDTTIEGKLIRNYVKKNNEPHRILVRNWTHEMIKYIKHELNDKHLNSIAITCGKNYSTTFEDPELFNIPEIDFLGLHDYIFERMPPTGQLRNRNLNFRFNSITDIGIGYQNKSLSYPFFQQKLFIYDEFGQIAAVPKEWPVKDETDPTVDYNNVTLFQVKQDMWFTATAGTALGGLDWWNCERLPRRQGWKEIYPGFATFFETIDFEIVNYSSVREQKGRLVIAQKWPITEKAVKSSNKKPYKTSDLLEAYSQVSDDGKQAFGWVNNRSYNWMNLLDSLPVLRGMLRGESPYSKQYLYLPSDDDLVDRPIEISDDTYYFVVSFLAKRTAYQVDFYNTTTGQLYQTKVFKSNRNGDLKVYAPEMKTKDNPDLAYKIFVKGGVFK